MKIINKIKQNKRIAFFYLGVFSVFLIFLLVPHFTYASIIGNTFGWVTDPVGSVLKAICRVIDEIGMGQLAFGKMVLGLALYLTGTLINTTVHSVNFQQVVGQSRSIALSLFGILLIIISFTQVLHFQTEKWGARAILPKLFLASFLMLFSLFICEVVYDIGDIATVAVSGATQSDFSSGNFPALTGPSGLFTNRDGNDYSFDYIRCSIEDNGPDCNGVSGSDYAQDIWIHIAFLITVEIGALGYLVLGVILIVRSYMIMILMALAPFAFAALVLPWTAKQHTKWWAEFAKWIFYLPLALLILHIGSTVVTGLVTGPDITQVQIMKTILGNDGNTAVRNLNTVSPFTQMMPMLLMVVGTLATVAAACYIPLKLLGSFGKIAQDWMKRNSKVGPLIDSRKANQQTAARQQANRWLNSLSRKTSQSKIPGVATLGGFATGRRQGFEGDEEALKHFSGLKAREIRDLAEKGHLNDLIEERGQKFGGDSDQVKTLQNIQHTLRDNVGDEDEIKRIARLQLSRKSDLEWGPSMGPEMYNRLIYGEEDMDRVTRETVKDLHKASPENLGGVTGDQWLGALDLVRDHAAVAAEQGVGEVFDSATIKRLQAIQSRAGVRDVEGVKAAAMHAGKGDIFVTVENKGGSGPTPSERMESGPYFDENGVWHEKR